MTQVVNPRLLVRVSSADARATAQSSEPPLERVAGDGVACPGCKKGGIGFPVFWPSAVILNQHLPELRPHGNQLRLAKLRVPNHQERPAQIHVGASQVYCFMQAQAGPIVHQNHCPDCYWLQADTLTPRRLDHFKKAAEFFPCIDVGNELRRALWHDYRERGCGDVPTAYSISEETPQETQLDKPRPGHWSDCA